MLTHSHDTLTITLGNEDATKQLAVDVAMAINGGALIFLEGDLGAGKTTFARSLIRQLSREPELEVPSPTFSIVQPYELDHSAGLVQILHVDLYRLSGSSQVEELGLYPLETGVIALVEWPQKGKGHLPSPDLEIRFETENEGQENEARSAILGGNPALLSAVRRSLLIRAFLIKGWGEGVERSPLMGDASSRSYETVILHGEQRILMNAPRQPDGPVIRDGKPYSQIARLAEDISAFVGVDRILAACSVRVPELYHQSLGDGLLLLEDLGKGLIITSERQPIRERYLASAAMLAEFHQKRCENHINIDENNRHTVPDYDREAMLIEVDLLAKWYAPRFKGAMLEEREYQRFVEIWNSLIDRLQTSEKRLNLRDFHSPNIIWRDQEQGNRKVAVIDFQDAVMGPSAYDLASLAQDARIDIPGDLEEAIVSHYCSLRKPEPDFDEAGFLADYAIMAALRATKILGIFVRLDERDGKPDYLKHLPRMQDYIKRAMRHEALADYKTWYESVMDLS